MKRGGKDSITQGKSSSGLGGLVAATKTYLKGQLKARRVVVKGEDVKLKTDTHYLNPRNQEALTFDAVSDIYDSIVENGVTVEGIAIEKDGKYYVLDSSRRRFCCIKGKVDLPLWVIEGVASDTQLLKMINDSQEVKKWSYPEHAKYLLKIADLKSIDTQQLKIDDLAKELGMGRESLRKRLESLDIHDDIRMVFVDYEGIPNTYYGELAKLQRQLTKVKANISEQVGVFTSKMASLSIEGTVSERQKLTLDALKKFVADTTKSGTKAKWVEKELGSFTNARTKVMRKVNDSTRKTVYEFTRLPKELQEEIDALIEAKLT